MNQKITLPKAARLIAGSTGLGVRQCEDFLKGLAEIVTESLVAGEQVKIKGLGTFRLTKVEGRDSVDVSTGEPNRIAEHTKVVFVPCREMAAQVNTPFEFFEAVEIDETVAEEDLEADVPEETGVIETVDDDSASDVVVPDVEIIEEEETASDADAGNMEIAGGEKMTETVSDVNIAANTVDKELSKDYIMETRDEAQGDANQENRENANRQHKEHRHKERHKEREHYREPRRHRFGWGFITGFGVCLAVIALGIGIGFVMMWTGTKEERALFQAMIVEDLRLSDPEEVSDINTPVQRDDVSITDNQESAGEEAEQSTSGDDVATAASDKDGVNSGSEVVKETSVKTKDAPVYDTISKTRYLTTMAKQHYGDFNLWPYIYEENKAILGHPDRIRPGTKVVIPPLSKYGVTGTAADIAKAKKLGAEIYARYK